jgi:general secretion pathway protein F
MPLYRYKAASPSGETSEGDVFAADEQQVIAQLQAAGQIPIRVVAGGGISGFRRKGVRAQDVQVFTQELATLLAAGLPLDKALQIILDLSEEARLQRMVGRVLDSVRGGAALSDALEAQSGVFSRFYVSMVRAGEMGGAMETVLNRLSEYLIRAKELRDSVVSALIYPAILMAVSVISVFILMVFVVPQFTQLFDDAGRALPMLTQVVVGSANFLREYWWILIGAVILGTFYMRRQLANPCFQSCAGMAGPCACLWWGTSSARSRPPVSAARWEPCWATECPCSRPCPSCARRSTTACSRRA